MGTNYGRGFTLVELLVTIAIIGILSGVVMTSVNGARIKAVNSNIQSSLRQLAAVAADPDNLNEGGEGEASCDVLFANAEMRRLINYAVEQAGHEVVYTYCSKNTSDYLFTLIAPKQGEDAKYLCVDQTQSVREVEYTNINSILSEYSCNAVAAVDSDVNHTPLTIISAVFEGSNNLRVTFNQPVWYTSLGQTGVPSISISDVSGAVYSSSPYNASLNGQSELYFNVSSPILCNVVEQYPWNTYSTDTHYLHMNDVYGELSETTGSMSVTITCPSPTLYCIGSLSTNCSGSDEMSCNSNSYCSWSAPLATCYGSPTVSCGSLGSSDCGLQSGCSWDFDQSVCGGSVPSCESLAVESCGSITGCYIGYLGGGIGSCSQNSSATCESYSGNDCPTQAGCSLRY